MIHVTSSMFMKNGGTCRALDATGDGDEKHRKHNTAVRRKARRLSARSRASEHRSE